MRTPAFLLAALALVADAQPPAPPLVTQVLNAASRMPHSFPGGAIARGSLFIIQGFRFGQVSVAVDSLPVRIVSESETEIKALMPPTAPLGRVRLTVTRAGKSSRPLDVNVVTSSFGILSHSRRGQTVTLIGTGLGTSRRPEVLVAGKPARHIRARHASSGTDQIQFEIPPETPQGCFIPVLVRTEGARTSNVVTIDAQKCTIDNWLAARLSRPGPAGLVVLARTLVEIDTNPPGRFESDSLLARFGQSEPVDVSLISPPLGACTAYAGTATLTTLAALASFDTSTAFTIQGPAGMMRIRGSGILGGSVPFMKRRPAPLYLKPGEYAVSGGVRTRIQVRDPLPLPGPRVVHVGSPFHLEWNEGRADDLLLLALANLDQETGALGVCACLLPAAAGRFTVPVESLSNLPLSRSPQGLPLSALLLVTFPRQSPPDDQIGVGVGLTVRSVRFEP